MLNIYPGYTGINAKQTDLIIYDSYNRDGTLDYSFLAIVINLDEDGNITVCDLMDLMDYERVIATNRYCISNLNVIVQNFGPININDYLTLYQKDFYGYLDAKQIVISEREYKEIQESINE